MAADSAEDFVSEGFHLADMHLFVFCSPGGFKVYYMFVFHVFPGDVCKWRKARRTRKFEGLYNGFPTFPGVDARAVDTGRPTKNGWFVCHFSPFFLESQPTRASKRETHMTHARHMHQVPTALWTRSGVPKPIKFLRPRLVAFQRRQRGKDGDVVVVGTHFVFLLFVV